MKKIFLFLTLFICIFLILIFIKREFFHQKNLNNQKDWESLIKITQDKSISSSNILIIFEDYRCPDCKSLNNNILNKTNILKKYNIKLRRVEMSFLSADSIKISAAANAVKEYDENQYYKFHNKMINIELNKGDNIDNIIKYEIHNLNIEKYTKSKIENTYKNKKSMAWKKAYREQKISEEYNINRAPTVYFNGHEIKHVEDKGNFEKEILKHLTK